MEFSNIIPLQEIIILPLAIILDLTTGELPEKAHPTVWMGKTAKFLESKLKTGERKRDLINGSILVIFLITLFVIPVYIISINLRILNWLLYIPVMTLLLKSTFSIRAMKDHVNPIAEELKKNNLENAKAQTSKIVSRDTSNLNEEEIVSAGIESTSEGITDGIIGPIFYFAFLGVPGAIGYRVINTLDSMFGYKDKEHTNFGRISANLDTIINYIPARLSVFFISISSWITSREWKKPFEGALKEGGKTDSLNAGYPMTAAAMALNVRLEKKNHYVLGKGNPRPEVKHLKQSLKIMEKSSIIFGFTLTIILFLISLGVG